MLRKHSQTGPIGSRPQLLASVAVLVLTLARPGITSAQDQPRVAQPTAQDVTSRVIARAQEALGRGDTAGASRVLSDWLKGHPNDVTARIALGAVYQSSCNPAHPSSVWNGPGRSPDCIATQKRHEPLPAYRRLGLSASISPTSG